MLCRDNFTAAAGSGYAQGVVVGECGVYGFRTAWDTAKKEMRKLFQQLGYAEADKPDWREDRTALCYSGAGGHVPHEEGCAEPLSRIL